MTSGILLSIGVIFVGIGSIINASLIGSLQKRVRLLEAEAAWRTYLHELENGESPSNIAYMKERGFLK